MEEDFKNSMKIANADIAVISQVLYEDDPSNRPTRGIVIREIRQAEDFKSQVTVTADKNLKGKEKIGEKSKFSKSKAKVIAKKKTVSKETKSQTLIDPIYTVVQAYDTGKKCEEEEIIKKEEY